MIKSLPNLYQFLQLREKEVKEMVSNLPNYYRYKRQPKKKHGEDQEDKSGRIRYRYLWVPFTKLKIIQSNIAGLLEMIELPRYMYGSVKGTNNIENASSHLNQQFFLTVDLKNFFPSINNSQVFAMLCSNGFSPAVARILTHLTTYKGSIPQGSPSSPVISNLVFMEAGNKINDLAKSNRLNFTTFLDDLTFSANHNFKTLTPEIIKIIKAHDFLVSYDKIHYRIGICEITGLFVKGNTLNLPYEMLARAKINPNVDSYRELVAAYNQRAANSNKKL